MILIKKGKEKASKLAKSILDYYKVIRENNESKKEFNDGYLVNKKVLDDLKEKIFYEDYLSNQEKYENIIKEKFKHVELKINSYEKIEFTTLKELLNNLNEKKEYAILNFTIWKYIKDENLVEKKIKYKVNNENKLVIQLNAAETVYFTNNLNIINESSYLGFQNSNKEKIEKALDCIKKYYIFRQSLIKELNEKQDTPNNDKIPSQILWEMEQKEKKSWRKQRRFMQKLKMLFPK